MKYFGTDGIRGVAGIELNEDVAFRCGYALGELCQGGSVVLARDTRESGEWLSEAFSAGIGAAGGAVIYGGILPTPAVAAAVKMRGAAFGAVISASHNPSHYNGIKLFGPHGNKLTKATEEQIERLMDKVRSVRRECSLVVDYSLAECYAEAIALSGFNLKGLNIVLDIANGAANGIAKRFFTQAGAVVHSINDSADGELINYRCGALHPQELQNIVVNKKADMGFAFDGDADRLIAVDEKGNLFDGDKILFALARDLAERDALPMKTVVATIMTNSAIERTLGLSGIRLIRVAVGDHNVCEEMKRCGYYLGGEQSGHIIFADTGTGDGILAALRLAKLVKQKGSLSNLCNVPLLPQISKNVTIREKSIPLKALENAECWRKYLKDQGRVLLRLSGTEPVIRIMAECNSAELAQLVVNDIEYSLNEEHGHEV